MAGNQTNLSWEVVLDVEGQGPGPLHERIKRALRGAIRAGRLPVGTALPPSRALAVDLGCSRWAVTEAYAQLTAEGYLESRTGSGTRVRWTEQGTDAAPAPATPGNAAPRIDLAPGLPDLRAFPRERWLEAVRSVVATAAHADLGYPAPGGHPHLRDVLGAYLERSRAASRRGGTLTVTPSASAAAFQVFSALAATGARAVGVEDPGWTRMHEVARQAGLRPVPIPVDEQGLRVDALRRQPGLRTVLVTPAHQFPTGVVLSPDRRADLLRWASEVDGLVVEDDYDAEFRYDRPPVATLQGMDPSRVALIGSLSKTLTPALGIGWLLAPSAWSARERPGLPDRQPPTLDQLAFAALLQSGAYDRHLRACRRRYRARRDALVAALAAALPECRAAGVAAGLHLLLHLPPGVPAADVVVRAARAGLRLAALGDYATSEAQAGSQALVLGYGNLLDSAVPEAAAVLRHAVRAVAGQFQSGGHQNADG